MAYRNDLDALEARHAALEAEVAEGIRARDEAAHLLAEARAREDANAEADVEPARRGPSLLAIAFGIGVVALIGGLTRCGTEGTKTEGEDIVQTFERFATTMCACQTPVCAQQVSSEVTAWGQLTANGRPQLVDHADPRTQQHIIQIAHRLSRCMQRAMVVPYR